MKRRHERRRANATEFVLRALLRAYPASFRQRYGAELLRLWLQRLHRARAGGRRAAVRAWAGALVDAVGNGTAERFAALAWRWRAQRMHVGGDPSAPGRSNPREERREQLMDGWSKDARFALRMLSRSPVFTAVAVLTIGLGIGANTAIFSVVRAVLLRPLPYPTPERLAIVWAEMTNRDILHFPSSPPDFRTIGTEATLLEELEAVFTFTQGMTAGVGDPEQVVVAGVTPGLLALLGATPLHGRLFMADDATPAPPPAEGEPAPAPGAGPPAMIVLSHDLWLSRFGGDAGVVGSTIDVGGNPAVIVGVMVPGLRLYMPPIAGVSPEIDLWMAARIDYANAPQGNVFLRPLARLKPGVSVAQAQAELTAIAARIRETSPRWETAGYRLRIVPLQADLTAEVRPIVLALMGAVGFVLLIACANVSNLLLVRASAREREMAVRAALGGSRLRIVRQVLLESGVLAVVGAAFGVGLAVLGIEVLLALQPGGLPRIDTVRVDTAVLAFTVSAALLSALLFGVLPAVQASRPDLARSLRDRGGTGGARAQALVRGTVVVLEVSLSLVLLIGAGLMLRSFGALRAVDPGFDAEGVLTFGVSLPNARYGSPTARAAFAAQFRERLNALPGVQVASAALPLPLAGETFNGPYGTLAARGNAELFRQADIRVVHPGYFETLRTRVLEGRAFSEADQADSTAVVVVDGVLARRAWPGESALGKRILVRFFSLEHVEAEVIGVVEHQRNGSLAVEGRETVYWPDRFAGSPGNMTWLVRGTGDPARHLAAARAELAALDPLLPLSDVRPLTDLVDRAQAATRFTLVLLVIFGLTALILAVVGLYGVLSYTVRQRTSEIGLRMAFGADAGAILGMVLQQGLRLTALGVVLGVAAALALTRVLESMLVGVEPTDAPTFAATVALFGAVATLACWLPARRATRVSPLVALQEP